MILIADGGATKTEWCILSATVNKKIKTQGISPYFLNSEQVAELLDQGHRRGPGAVVTRPSIAIKYH